MKRSNECKGCPCKKINCIRHGQCHACRSYHKTHQYVPACDRLSKKSLSQTKVKETEPS